MDVVEVRAQLLHPGFVDGARADVDAQLVALAGVAGVHDPLDHHAVGGDAVLLELPARLLLELAEAPLDAGRVQAREALVRRGPVLVDHVRRQKPHRRGDARIGRNEHVRRPHLERDLRREERPRAALGDEREVARVEALAHGVLLDRLHHRVREDLDGAHGRLLDAHPERRPPDPPRRPCAPGPAGAPSRRRGRPPAAASRARPSRRSPSPPCPPRP